MGLISTRKLGKSGVSQCSERLDIHMINKSIQRSCQWEGVFQMFLSDVIFLELGSPRWRCNWNFGKVPAWSGLGGCFWNIQFCSSPCQGPRGAGSQAQGVGYGLLWGLYGIQEPAHGKPLCRSCSPQHWGGTFSFSNAKNSFRNAGHKVKYQPSFMVLTCCPTANSEGDSWLSQWGTFCVCWLSCALGERINWS